MTRLEELKDRFDNLRGRIGNANLVAVTKKTNVQDILFSYEIGQRDFGENRVQDLLEKAQEIENLGGHEELRWHFIGHLQSNKIKKLAQVPHLYSIHSIDSLGLFEKLLQHKDFFKSSKIKIFFQVNTSGEEEKGGFLALPELLEGFKLLEDQSTEDNSFPFQIFGLMTMGRIRTESFEEDATKCFRQLVNLKGQIQEVYPQYRLELSMGMTKDVEIAVQEGSSWVRVGSFLYS